MLVAYSPTALLGASIFILFAVSLLRKFYATLTHPLRKFPGPLLCSISNVWYSYWYIRDRKEFRIHELHQKYGPVVRIAPNDLSFNTAQSWKDIYGFRPGHATFLKDPFYDKYSFIEEGVHGIITSRDPGEHAHMRRYLSHAFSEKALREQEGLVAEIVDGFIDTIRTIGVDRGEVMNFERWLTCCTLDVTGSLVFGQSFDAVKNGGQHPRMKHIVEARHSMKITDTIDRFPWSGKLFALSFSPSLMKLMEGARSLEQFSLSIIEKRFTKSSDRPDFLTKLQENPDPAVGQPSHVQIACHVSEILQAGADTSNTTICTVLNYVLRDAKLYNRLCHEVRGKFKTYENIKAQECATIPYLRLLILEALRIYPPVPSGMTRLAPKGGDTVDGVYVPEGMTVSTNAYSACLTESNFHDPFKFKPERWEKGNTEKHRDVLEASQPFLLGPRGCIGQNLAWMEMNTIICKLFWSFDFELVNKEMDLHRDSTVISLWESPPLLIRTTDRFTA